MMLVNQKKKANDVMQVLFVEEYKYAQDMTKTLNEAMAEVEADEGRNSK
jgi:hypothetical protein